MVKVIKRDGREVEFDKQKIVNAITLAMVRTDLGVDHVLAQAIADKIEDEVQAYDNSAQAISIEKIQDMVESNLMASDRREVAKEYILYRAERTKRREKE